MSAGTTLTLAHAIRRAADDVFDRVMEDLATAVRTPSVNPMFPDGPGEGALQDWIAGTLEGLGCRVQLLEPDADALAEAYPAIRPFLGRPFAGRPNVLAAVGGTDPSAPPHLLLNSHADTVAPGPDGAWSRPPFSAAREGDALYGLGAADAKGSLVAFVGALRALRRAGVRPARGLMIQSVVDEEAGGAGALDLIRRGHTASAAVVGEPSELRICPGSRGTLELHLEIIGRKAHPGEGWRGVNAAHLAARYVAALEQLREELDRTAMHPLWAPLPMGHVWNLMALNTGPSIRAVPDRCRLEYSIGMIGEETAGTMRTRVEAALDAVTGADGWLREHPPVVTWSDRVIDAAVAPADHAVVRAMVEAGGALGEAPVVEALSAATDGRYLSRAAGIPTLNFGPGEMFRGHSPDERLSLSELRRAVSWLALFIALYCGAEGGPS